MNTYLNQHQLAKKLNNTAALCIETGHYERGISCLVEALQLSDRQNVPQHISFKPDDMMASAVCQCKHCSLDECIIFSERTPLASSSSNSNGDTTTTNNHKDGYIHRRPIRVTPQSTQDGHNMGVTLSLIITFNLALAHHLSALSTFGVDRNIPSHCSGCNHNHNKTSPPPPSTILRKSSACKQTFQKILHLYELAYRWQIELEEDRIQKLRRLHQQQLQPVPPVSWDTFTTSMMPVELDASPVTSLRFNMIISNNLSQIHRLVQNHAKHQRCLEHLLATMMFVIVTDRQQQQQQQWTTRPTTSRSSSSSSMTAPYLQQQQEAQYMDFEGFLLNATHLILQDECAGAA